MTENTKARLRFAWRAVEALLALGLLAILAELVLVLVNSPTPTPEIRFIRREVSPEAAPEIAVNNAPEKLKAAPEIAVPAKPKDRPAAVGAAAPPPRDRIKVNHPPARPETPPLLDFANLRRVIGLTPARNPSPVSDDTRESQIVVINPIVVPGTNGLPNGGGNTNTPPATNAPGSTTQTNDMKSSGTSTNLIGPTYRLSVP